jgi:hypothetical protein
MLPIAKHYRQYVVTASLASLLSGLLTWLYQPIEIMVLDRVTHQPIDRAQITIQPKTERLPGISQRFRLTWFMIPGTVVVQAAGYQMVQTKILLIPNGEYKVELEPLQAWGYWNHDY